MSLFYVCLFVRMRGGGGGFIHIQGILSLSICLGFPALLGPLASQACGTVGQKKMFACGAVEKKGCRQKIGKRRRCAGMRLHALIVYWTLCNAGGRWAEEGVGRGGGRRRTGSCVERAIA
jgi:hypothetical protein